MPLLQAEPEIFPETLLDGAEPSAGNWWVVYTLARREKQLCRQLWAKQIPFYCPTIARRYRSPAGRARTSHLPLFPNYVFFQGDEDQRYQSLATGCVIRCLPVADPVSFVQDLRQINRLITSGVSLTPEDQLQVGLRVRVKNGPLLGLEGTVMQRRNGRHLLVEVNLIQRGASLELGEWELEPVSEPVMASPAKHRVHHQ